MKSLLNRLNKNTNSDNYLRIKNRIYINYNTKRHHIFLRLGAILYNEKKRTYYKNIVFRVFSYFLAFLEKTKSNSISIINRNNKKYYYTSRLNLKDAETFFINSEWSRDTKFFYLSILKKYIKTINGNKKIKFSKAIKSELSNNKKKYIINDNIRSTIRKLKDSDDCELICSFYVLYYLGLSFYQFSKLLLKNYNRNKNIISFVSYKFKKKIIKKKKITKVMIQYFNKFISLKEGSSGFLFFDNIRDEKGKTRKNKLVKKIAFFINKKLGISASKAKEYIRKLDEERSSIRIGSKLKNLFEPFVKIIDDSNIF